MYCRPPPSRPVSAYLGFSRGWRSWRVLFLVRPKTRSRGLLGSSLGCILTPKPTIKDAMNCSRTSASASASASAKRTAHGSRRSVFSGQERDKPIHLCLCLCLHISISLYLYISTSLHLYISTSQSLYISLPTSVRPRVRAPFVRPCVFSRSRRAITQRMRALHCICITCQAKLPFPSKCTTSLGMLGDR